MEDYISLRRDQMKVERVVEQDATVRIVWLINGIQDANLPAAPDDLLPVVKDLDKLGVKDLRLAAQAMVKTTGSRHFEIHCSPQLKNPCEFDVDGELINSGPDADGLNIRLSATEKVPVPEGTPGQFLETKRLCNLDATVRAPRGHTVVLGVAPTEKKTSVFVVQITAEEK